MDAPMRRVSSRVVEKQAAAAAATVSGGDTSSWPTAGGAGDAGLNTSFLTSMNVRVRLVLPLWLPLRACGW
jgi:hypothetical protein